jgi:small subunit ribosomal protein S13
MALLTHEYWARPAHVLGWIQGERKMARIAGVDLPRDKRVDVALTYIYGIGHSRSQQMLHETGVTPDTQVKDLTEAEIVRLREFIDTNYRVEGDLRRQVSQDIRRLMDIGCYRGLRHRRGLPVHGQRTRTNARTRKGPKKTVAGRGRRRGVAKK